MDKVEERMKVLEEEVTQLKLHMLAKDKGLEEQKKALVDYIDKEFATHTQTSDERNSGRSQNRIHSTKVQPSTAV